jgi:hypothetical protein
MIESKIASATIKNIGGYMMRTYLKVLAAATVVLITMLIMGACGASKEAPPVEEVQPGGLELLSGYPEDILPLYKSTTVESVGFFVRGDDNYVFGKDIYTVNYISSASAKDVIAYYRGLATSIDEEYSTSESLTAAIGENPVGVLLYEGENGLSVSLTLGMKPTENVEVNPYFSDYPGDLIEPFGRMTFSEQGYEARGINSTEVIYTESYITNVDKEAFREFYATKYAGAENLNVEEDEYGLTYQWTDRGYTCRASISTNGGPSGEFVTTIASKEMN